MSDYFNKPFSNNINLPNTEGMFPHQLKVFEDPHRFLVLIWHRRSRKTSTALEKLVLEAHNPDLPPSSYWLVLPTYSMAKESIWKDPSMLFRIIPPQLIDKTNESELVVYFKNGSNLTLKGSDNPDSLRGAGPRGVVLDEYGTMKPEVWPEIIQPILRANGGWCWFIGTPRGKNHLYELYLKGQEPSTEWKSWKLQASKSNVLPKDALQSARENMPEPLYLQEFECAFLEGEGSVFRGVKEACTASFEKPLDGHTYVMGVDLGRHVDYTVISIFDRANNNQVFQDRFRTIEWPFQKRKIIEYARHYNHASLIMDSTGIGDPIMDDLAREGLAIEGFKFTESSKKELVEKLSLWIEQRKISILPLEENINELEAFSYTIGPTGKIKYGAPSNYHDDCVISIALSCHVLNPKLKGEDQKGPSLMHQAKLRAYLMHERAQDYISAEEWGEWGEIEPGF